MALMWIGALVEPPIALLTTIVFDGPEDYHHRIDDAKLEIDEHSILFIRGTGPIGYPGGAEVVNMQPPAALPVKPEGSGCVRGTGDRVRRAGGLSPPHRRPEAQD